MKKQRILGDPKYQPTEQAPKGTTVTPPLPRGGGINRRDKPGTKGPK